jgi:hypothetical protein
MFLTYPAYFLAVDADDHANQLAPALVTLTNFQTHGDEATLAQFQTLSPRRIPWDCHRAPIRTAL